MHLSTAHIVLFHKELTRHYYEAGRHHMPWRRPDENGYFDPYKILISEIMLQQTGVDRVTPKYLEFVESFPSVRHLANAELGAVLRAWNGLGYNRRAKYLWHASQMIANQFQNGFPRTTSELVRLPGVGVNTAGAIVAYAYNQPVIFIETNIRTVVIHHFYRDKTGIPDSAIHEVMAQLIPQNNDMQALQIQGAQLEPREFYWALMDYGTHLKKTVGNLNVSSKHYAKQAKFEGSQRQIRGQVIRLLTKKSLSKAELMDVIADQRLDTVLNALIGEEMIKNKNGRLHLS